MKTYHVLTFGCKVNQYESAALAAALEQAGWTAAAPGAPPALAVVNTCTVTARADQQARQAIRRLARLYPGASVVVTGCYAERAPGELARLPGVAGIVGNPEKPGLAALAATAVSGAMPFIRVNGYCPGSGFQFLETAHFPGHTRAWLKIQDGCAHACSYCIVPRVRGPARSLDPAAVEAALLRLAEGGYPEIVLTGIDLGQYGRDLTPSESLAGLLRRLARRPWPCRFRLSSLEPREVTGALLEAAAALPGLCPHFHLPLQSASDRILAAMNRPYPAHRVRDLAWELISRFPGAALGFDVLTGFPGETEADFAATHAFLETLPLAYLHVFPFSPRPGTPAAALPRLPAGEVRRRAHILRELGRAKKAAFLHAQVGSCQEVLVEGPASTPGRLRGLSANYLRVVFPGPRELRGQRRLVRFTGVRDEVLTGEMVP
jgi:threonylcarbamoyladenosine tRNA methylthiotransferase MtaB